MGAYISPQKGEATTEEGEAQLMLQGHQALVGHTGRAMGGGGGGGGN